jgi:hypothetical protein
MILLHGWYNTVNTYLILSFENMVSTLSAVLPWTVALVVAKRYGDDHLADHQRPMLHLEPFR